MDQYRKDDMRFVALLTFCIIVLLFAIGTFVGICVYIFGRHYTERQTIDGVTCIVKHNELTGSVDSVKCPVPYSVKNVD